MGETIMKRIAFHNREKETKEIMDILDDEPSLITFVYGPINSGKTTTISHLIKELPEDYAPFYVNLRGRFVTDYEDFLNVLFEIDEEEGGGNVAEYAKSALKDLGTVSGIPIPINLFERIFEKKDKSKDMFRYIERFFAEISKTRTPILIIDELQVIGDLKIDGLLIYKLFNFFIRLTKETHLAQVFVVTSDSLFLENVYSEAMLDGRCRYLLVDDFDHETTSAFLDKYGFTDDDIAMAWESCGGKPVCLVELVNTKLGSGDITEKTDKMLEEEISRLVFLLARNKETKSDIIDMLTIFASVEEVKYSDSMEIDLLSFLVKQNILFLDSARRTIKPQSRLNLLAIREVIADA
ncbi:MAG: ATP-binding protein [Candidatus Methanogaster sp.]|uniref:ATP-binding protein n=1 Tax=Candidatus Methanogaster sp. TaxID=3386292 RepID=A0AC61L1M5_9EURY|nr:MAG: ATP-binding protein [ANME-2 cluster archaeon]